MEAQKVLQTDLLDIVFEGRNKNYGAYALRQSYEKNVKKAMFIGTLAVAFFAGAPFVYSKIMSNLLIAKPEERTVVIETKNIEILKEKIIVPPPPKEVKLPPQNTSIYVPPVVKIDDEVKNEVPPTPPVAKTIPWSSTTRTCTWGSARPTVPATRSPSSGFDVNIIVSLIP